MKRIIAYCAIFALAMNQSSAKEIDVEEALNIAKEFRTKSASSSRRGVSANYSLEVAAQTDNYYAFNYSGKGFVIVANDDAVTNPVIGYSDTGTFNTETMSPGLKAWLEVMSRQIEAVKANPASARGPRKSPKLVDRANIAPMLTSKWGQKYPYNLEVVSRYSSLGTNLATGCVATAMAQIMYYHKWPQSGRGSNAYIMDLDTIVANYDGRVYDWEGMTDTYTYDSESNERACNAVARLMHDAGTSVNMDYGYASGAFSECVPSALFKNFSYSGEAKILYLRHFTADQWEDSIYSSLANDGPVYYAGSSEDDKEGHAFVCDGYKDGYFHMNFGWDGQDDSYFRLNIGAGLEFSYDSEAVVHIKPATHEEEHSIDLVASAYINHSIPVISDSIRILFKKNASYSDDIKLCAYLRDDKSGKEFYFEPRVQDNNYLREYYNYICFDIKELSKHDGLYKFYLVYKEKDGSWATPFPLSETMEKKYKEGLDSIAVKNGKCIRMSDYTPVSCVEFLADYPDTMYVTEGDTLKLDVNIKNGGFDTVNPQLRLFLRLDDVVMMKRGYFSPSQEVEPDSSLIVSIAFPMDLPAEYDVLCNDFVDFKSRDIGVKKVIVTPKNNAPCTLLGPVSYKVDNDMIHFDFDLKYNGASDDNLTLRVNDNIHDRGAYQNRYDYENVGTVHHSCNGPEEYHVRFSRHIKAISSRYDCMLYLLCETENGTCMVENASYVFNLEDLGDEILSNKDHINYANEKMTAKYRFVAKYKNGESVSFLLSDKPKVIPSSEDMSITIKTETSCVSIAVDDIRNIVLENMEDIPTSIDAINSGSGDDIAITVADARNYIVNGANNKESIRVYATNGTAVTPSMYQLSDGMIRMSFNSLPNGIYIVTVNSRQTFKIYVK